MYGQLCTRIMWLLNIDMTKLN